MKCPICRRVNPDDAHFCIYCAAHITPVIPAPTAAPVTGPTTRLDPSAVPLYTMPAVPAKAAPQVHSSRRGSRRHQHNDGTWSVWLIGIGILMLSGSFFPGILVLIGLTKYLKASRRGRYAQANQRLVFWAGLAAIFWLGLSWPLFLLWGGLLMLLNQRNWCTP